MDRSIQIGYACVNDLSFPICNPLRADINWGFFLAS